MPGTAEFLSERLRKFHNLLHINFPILHRRFQGSAARKMLPELETRNSRFDINAIRVNKMIAAANYPLDLYEFRDYMALPSS